MKEEKIEQFYRKSGFEVGATKLLMFIKGQTDEKVTLKEVKDFLNKQEVVQIVKPPPKQKFFNSIRSPEKGYSYQMDIMVFTRREFNGFKYILSVIDVYSRYVMCVAMKTRKQKQDGEVIRAVRKIFNTMGFPKNLNCDNEFTSAEFNKLMEENNVNVFLSYADDDISSKNALIERFNRTLAGRIRNYINATGNRNWVANLSTIVEQYNKSFHSTIKNTPFNIWTKGERNLQNYYKVRDDLLPGQFVRIRTRIKGAFSKGDLETYGDDLFKLVRKDEKLKNRWIVLNLRTGEEGNRPYLPKELVVVHQVEQPKIIETRQKKNEKEYAKQVKQRRETGKQLKLLESDLTEKFLKPAQEKRVQPEKKQTKSKQKPKGLQLPYKKGDILLIKYPKIREKPYEAVVQQRTKTYIKVYFEETNETARIDDKSAKFITKKVFKIPNYKTQTELEIRIPPSKTFKTVKVLKRTDKELLVVYANGDLKILTPDDMRFVKP